MLVDVKVLLAAINVLLVAKISSITGLVKVLFVKVCEAVNNVIVVVLDKSVEAIVMFAEPSND